MGGQPCYIPCLHWSQPLDKLERSSSTMIFYIFTMSTSFLAYFFFVMPFHHSYYSFYPITTLFGVQWIFFFLSSFKDPGIVKKSSKISFLKMMCIFKNTLFNCKNQYVFCLVYDKFVLCLKLVTSCP